MKVLICEPNPTCRDPHIYRWHCMKGHDGAPAGVCPLRKCNPNYGDGDAK